MDTSGQERFNPLSKKYYEKADGVLLHYDITDEESFKSIDYWIEEVIQ